HAPAYGPMRTSRPRRASTSSASPRRTNGSARRPGSPSPRSAPAGTTGGSGAATTRPPPAACPPRRGAPRGARAPPTRRTRPAGVREVGLPAVPIDRGPGRHHPGQVVEGLDVPDVEHLVELLVGLLVELIVPVGAPVDRVDPPADRLAAALVGGHRHQAEGEV